MIESGPIPAVHGVVRWRLIDLTQWIYFAVRVDEVTHEKAVNVEAVGIQFQDEARVGQKNKITRRWPAPDRARSRPTHCFQLHLRRRLSEAG
jgi:hypothetical protein